MSTDLRYKVASQRQDSVRRVDALLHVDRSAGELFVAVETSRNRYPRDIRAAIRKLDEYRMWRGKDDVIACLRPAAVVSISNGY